MTELEDATLRLRDAEEVHAKKSEEYARLMCSIEGLDLATSPYMLLAWQKFDIENCNEDVKDLKRWIENIKIRNMLE